MLENNKNELVEQLHRIADVLENSRPEEPEQMDEQTRKKAAYALNLCLVSVSQIIDYSDIYILEQEYQGILNNLNLEHMPKDEALLDILRQILDTITFFRIQEEEKRFIEQDYKRKMKAAIWKAIPGCQMFVGPWQAMLAMLVTQVGTGYMNYRNAKSQANQEYEKERWALQQAAIEQFNGLRRELFTTAWKLAERYNFEDAWRLTENQITQYNRVLMDSNLSRRLARLEDLEESFRAYPPFWYFKGHTALLLSQGETAEAIAMKEVAKAAFEEYFIINGNGHELLRTDPIYATCALEYVSLLGESETDKKREFIQRAIKHAGTHFDILQLCATAYLDIGETDSAARILRQLVCEGYNEEMNAQLLSTLYVENFLRDGNAQYRAKYNFLCKFANEETLIPWPQTPGTTLQNQYTEFIANRRDALRELYGHFLVQYFSQKARECRAVAACKMDSREKGLVRFIREMKEELCGLPYADIGQEEFVRHISLHRADIQRMITTGKCTNKTFETVFSDVFLTIAEKLATMRLSTMEEITRLENELSAAAGRLVKESTNGMVEERDAPDNTLQEFLEETTCTSERFKEIRKKVKNRSLLKPGARHTKLLLSGEQEYYTYIRHNDLSKSRVVAVLNDRSAMDCDLIITETGLDVLTMQNGAAMGAKLLLLGPAALVEYGVRAILPTEVPYADVIYKEGKLKKPGYRNKDVNMDELFLLIDEIKQTQTDNSIESKIFSTIVSSGPQL